MSVPATARAVPLRIATFNVRELLDDTLAVREVLRETAADVVCLQEVPTHVLARHRLGVLAADTGMWVAASGPQGAGTAVLTSTRVDVRAAGVRSLPTPRRRGWRPVRRRGTAEAVVRVPSGQGWSAEVLVRSVHLGLDEGERFGHLSRLAPGCAVDGDVAPWREAPTVVAGDLNEEPGGPVHQRLCTVLVDVAAAAGTAEPTFPARAPHRRLDLLLADRQLAVVAAHVPTGHPGASDHLPVVADLLVPAGPR